MKAGGTPDLEQGLISVLRDRLESLRIKPYSLLMRRKFSFMKKSGDSSIGGSSMKTKFLLSSGFSM